MASTESLMQESQAVEETTDTSIEKEAKLARLKGSVLRHLDRTPLLRKLPPRAIGIIVLLVTINLIVWAAAGIVLAYHPALTGTAVLAYTFGLRHALDADHISAIDLMTRRLVASGQRPVTVGTWFSLGHSTIVIITSIVVAASAAAISSKFSAFSYVGGIIGSSISSAFLLLLGLANAYILFLIVRQLRRLLKAQREEQGEATEQFKLEGAGFFFRIFKRLFKLIDRPWKMYPLGILFGLGFDTSSEIALLGISSIQATRGTSLWLILIFPALFTAGMCLLDTIDGALMLALYSSVSLARDAIAIAYYNCVLTVLTIVVAAVIGVLQILGLVVAVVGNDKLEGNAFWSGVIAVGNRYDIVGGAICAMFVFSGVLSVLCYKRWRQWVDQGKVRDLTAPHVDLTSGSEAGEHGTALSPVEDGGSTAGTHDSKHGDVEIVLDDADGEIIVYNSKHIKGFSEGVEQIVSNDGGSSSGGKTY